MVAHSVRMQIADDISVGKVGVEFEVHYGHALIGRVRISQGGLDFLPANKNKRFTRKASWEEFAEWMMSG